MPRSAFWLAATLAMVVSPAARAETLYPVPQEERRIALHAPLLAGAEETHVQYTGFWHREDYARFRSRRALAEVVYAAADPYENAALDVPLTFRRARDSFAVNAGGLRETGPVRRLNRGGGTLFFQGYELADRGWSCISFMSEWDHVGRDPRNRPARAVFGYACDTSGAPIGEAAAARLAGSVATRGEEVDWRGHGPARADAATVGARGFPYKFGRHFNDHDTDSRSD